MFLLVSRKIVFRADHAGIVLGPGLRMLQVSAVFVRWADIKKIIFYTITARVRRWAASWVSYIGIVPYARAPETAQPAGSIPAEAMRTKRNGQAVIQVLRRPR